MMDAPTDLYADARNNMVDGQVRPNKVTDRRILAAMRRLKREMFVPPAARALAYADVEVPVGNGRFLLPPMVVARLVQVADVRPGASVLVLGAGYAAALLAAIGAQVTAVEPDAPSPITDVQDVVPFRLVRGPLHAGWPDTAPYDCILIDGAVRLLPPLAAQLRTDPPGRLCAVLVGPDRAGVAVIAERAGDHLSHRPVFDCSATPLPHFDPPRPFQF